MDGWMVGWIYGLMDGSVSLCHFDISNRYIAGRRTVSTNNKNNFADKNKQYQNIDKCQFRTS